MGSHLFVFFDIKFTFNSTKRQYENTHQKNQKYFGVYGNNVNHKKYARQATRNYIRKLPCKIRYMVLSYNFGSTFIFIIKLGVFVALHIDADRFLKDFIVKIFIEFFPFNRTVIIGKTVYTRSDKFGRNE